MKVKFLVDYRGKLTKERFYKAGETRLFQDWNAKALIDRGVAVEFKEESVEVEPEVVVETTPEQEVVVEDAPKVKPKKKPKRKSTPKKKAKK